jgi:hypothetical protein
VGIPSLVKWRDSVSNRGWSLSSEIDTFKFPLSKSWFSGEVMARSLMTVQSHGSSWSSHNSSLVRRGKSVVIEPN